MSYTILYAKQFIKIDETRVIPFILQGDNNVYESNRKRARDWSNSRMFNRTIITSKEALLQEIERFKQDTVERCNEYVKQYDETWAYDEKRFGYHTGIAIGGSHTTKTSFSMFKNFFVSGINNAKTIEQLRNLGCSLGIRISTYDNKNITEAGLEIKPTVNFTSTEQAVATIEEYEAYYKGHNVYLYIYAYGMDRVVQKTKKTKRPKQKEKVDHYFQINTPFGLFVKNTSRTFQYSGIYNAKAFRTEKAANKSLDILKNKFPQYKFSIELVQKEAYV
jgi:hypothetical protein